MHCTENIDIPCMLDPHDTNIMSCTTVPILPLVHSCMDSEIIQKVRMLQAFPSSDNQFTLPMQDIITDAC